MYSTLCVCNVEYKFFDSIHIHVHVHVLALYNVPVKLIYATDGFKLFLFYCDLL